MKGKPFVKIEAGKYKNKKLSLPPSNTTRSTKSIVKNSFFDTVQFEILDKVFFEVFGGSGSMGLEAISRGADFAYFIEKDKNAYETLLKNCKIIDKEKTKAILGDSFELYEDILSFIKLSGKKAYIYFDPPFEIREGMQDVYEKVYSLIEQTPSEITEMITIEHRSKTDIPEKIGKFKKIKTKKFGKTSLSHFKAKEL